jgi:hypothetical protein
MPAYPMPMAMRYPLPPQTRHENGPRRSCSPNSLDSGEGQPCTAAPLILDTNHLPPSSMPVAGYPYHLQMYAYPMYYMRGSAAPFHAVLPQWACNP